MNHQKKRYFHFFLGITVSVFVAFFFFSVAETALAQGALENGDVFGTQDIDQNVALGGNSLQKTVVRIINVALGLLGIIALGIVLYGGYIYMTSGGSEEKIAEAKKILVNGTIGLAIILSAWAITSFVLNRLGEATGVRGLGNDISSACRDPEFANNNPDQCFGNGGFDIPGGENIDCAVRNRGVLLTRGITPSGGGANTPTGMNNVRVRVLFNNSLLPNDPTQVFDLYRMENGQEVTTTASFAMRFVDDDPALLEATFQGQNGLDQLPQGEYKVKVNKNLKGRNNQNLVERVACGEFPSEASFTVNTEGVVDNQAPVVGPVMFNGRQADPQGEQLNRGRVNTFLFNVTDNSGVGVIQYHVTVSKEGREISQFDSFDIPRISRGSAATDQDPFATKLPLILPANTELFTEYRVLATVFDIDGNSVQVRFQGIVVGADCRPGDNGPECLDDDRACTSDLQCPSRKCVNNQCVAWPVITNINGEGGVWDGAAGNFVTVEGDYFGEVAGHVYFGYEDEAVVGGMRWVEALLPVCSQRDVWHDEWIIVAVPADDTFPIGKQAIIKVERAREANQEQALFDTTIDNHGPIPGPNRGRFTKNDTKRPGICNVGVAGGHPSIPRGATQAPPNTSLEILGTSFGVAEQGTVRFGTAQAEAEGWSDDGIRTRIPANMRAGIVGISVTQNGIVSNHFPFVVSSTLNTSRPTIISIDPVTTTRRSYITIVGQGFGQEPGEVFLAPDATTDCRPEGRFNAEICKKMDTRTCGETWSRTQIIAQVPEDIAFKNWVVRVERSGDLVTSQDQTFLGVEDGAPNPGICFFKPTSGPAPLPENSAGLKFRGINFSNTPKIYFWPKGANEKDVNGWLVQQGDKIHTVDAESQGGILTVTTSIPVVNGITLSKGPAPIRIKNADGGLSNAVVYTVDDCRESGPLDGYQCCIEGPDAGFFKPNNQICKGQVRDAGYAWRFTTGRIPEMPQVAERCVTSTPVGEPPVFPSPAPWQNWLRNDLACVNQSVVVAFRLPEGASLVRQEINPNTVRVFSCEDKNGIPDCSGNKKVPVAYDNDDLQLDANSYLTIVSNPLQGPSQLQPNTWYHVEISKNIHSTRQVAIAGGQQEERVGLLIKRPCGSDTAYCFDFKTGSAENRCTLDRVGVIPNPFRVDYLGVLQLPGFYDPTRIMDPLASTTLYYKVWGTGSQDCSVVDVRGLGWNWSTNDIQKATAVVTPQNDAKATVTSLGNTVPETVKIQAHAVVDQENKDGEADLTIDLGEPKVTDFWPSCTESCIEAGLGVRFSRQMFQSSFAGNIKLYKCTNELCNDPADAFVATDPIGQDYFTYRFAPNSGTLDKDSWYKVVVGEAVQGLGSLGEKQESGHPEDDAGGKSIQEFTWRFRTTAAPDGNCIADKVVLEPKNFVARQIGERTQYNARPRTAANKCSKLGQDLNPWVYGWDWKVVTPDTNNAAAAGHEVAEITTYSLQGKIKPYCGLTCLPLGSDTREISNGHYPVCGDGVVGPGEDCDLGVQNPQGGLQEVPGVSCLYNCLRPGNKNAGQEADQLVCGNGVVNTTAGEECDPGDIEQRSYCTTICTHKGSGSRLDNATTTAWCGSGDVANGEECDIESMATSTSQGRIGCSNKCLHVGSSLSQDWCTRHAEEQYGETKVKDKPECAAAISICGNGILEIGEECERRLDGGAGIQAAIDIERRQSVNVPNAGPDVCSNNCLLQNICGLNVIPARANGGPRCEPGAQGCNDGCHVAGSSVTYDTPSFCGDTVQGLGEYPLCEYGVGEANNPPSLGQNPVQMVTAVGKGEIDNQSRVQGADIIAQLKNMRGENKEVRPSPNQPVGREPYSLQCGFTESGILRFNVAQNADADMELPDTVRWFAQPWEQREPIAIEKTRVEKTEGQQGMHVSGKGVVSLKEISFESGKEYEITFDYKFAQGTNEAGFLFAYGFENNDPSDILENQIVQGEDFNLKEMRVSNEWGTYRRIMVVPENGRRPLGIALTVTENANLFIDNLRIVEYVPLFESLTNDCPGNVDNGFGVGTNSCCYSRAHRVASIPQPFARGVCRNAYISVDFNEYITESSLQNNVILVSGHAAGHQCAPGEANLTAEVTSLIEAFDPDLVKADQPGLLRRMWTSIKHFFARIFGLQNALAAGGELKVWCSHPNALVPTLSYSSEPDFSATTTTVALALQEALLKDTNYVLLLKGGQGGIADVRGVGIRSNNPKLNNKYLFTDFIAFKTGQDICRINHVEVNPESYLFVKPNTTSTFEAKVVSDNNQFISPLPIIYDWTWSWLPQNNPIFSIPVPNTTSTESSIIIGSKNVEGTITASALARVIKDVSLVDRHEGRVFSDGVELNADFCDNPWPPREFYPFEEGVNFGKMRNQDGFTAEGVFNGSELPAIRIGDGVNGTDAFFNVSFSYCADANRTGTTTDDLPYLKPILFGDLVQGVCTVQGAQAQGGDDGPALGGLFGGAGGRPDNNDLFDVDPLQDFDFGDIFGGAGPNAALTCSLDSQCKSISRDSFCRKGNVERDPTLSGDVLKKFLFINDKNDDAIGLQIVANPRRFSAHQWYENEFPGSNLASIRDITMAGYDAVTDGKSYYVNALNQSGGPTSGVYNNIYILSINNTAQAETQKVFEQILSSLKFNINVSDIGYCLAANDGAVIAQPAQQGRCEFSQTGCIDQCSTRTGEISINGRNERFFVPQNYGYCAMSNAGQNIFALIEDRDRLGYLFACQDSTDCRSQDWFERELDNIRVRNIRNGGVLFTGSVTDFMDPSRNTLYSQAGTVLDCVDPQFNANEFAALLGRGFQSIDRIQQCIGGRAAIPAVAGNLNQQQTLLNNFDRLSEITNTACQNDFQCRTDKGLALEGTNGVCSNAKIKLLRDWDRLNDIRLTQKKLDVYKTNSGSFPQFAAGSFMVGYTNSRWGSWNLLGQAIGGAPVDPINLWSKCEDVDPQTCWNAASSTVSCPLVSSILEYSVSSSTGYLLHSPLEYFNFNEPLNPVIREFVPNVNQITTEPWCTPDAVISAAGGNCGNGVVNVIAGEECDPAGTSSRVNEGFVFDAGQRGVCQFQNEKQCSLSPDCDFTGEIAIDGNRERFFSSKSGYCVMDGSSVGILEDRSQPQKLIACERQSDCGDFDFVGAQSLRIRNIQTGRTLFSGTGQEFIDQYRVIFGREAEVECFNPSRLAQGQGNINNHEHFRALGYTPIDTPQVCRGGRPAVDGDFGQCPLQGTAQRVCTDQCKWLYGSCQVGVTCGNGRVELGETCDSGNLNGSYGHCNSECTAPFADFCGNGRIDRRDNQPIEACEYVQGSYIMLNYTLNQNQNPIMYGRFPLSFYGRFMEEGFCEDDDTDNCDPIRNSTRDFVADPAFNFNKRCSGDKSIVCRNNNDCIGLVQGKRIVNVTDGVTYNDFDWALNNTANFGSCEEQNIRFGSLYGVKQELSCNASCSAVSEYCGDGRVQNLYENCDDQNNRDGDGCNKYCRSEGQAPVDPNAPAAAGSCGNSRVDAGEACDLGNGARGNGVICTPGYGRSCTYCASDCTSVLTVDPSAFCGDNIFQQGSEQCDMVNNEVVTTTPNGVAQCPRNFKGDYSCKNQCSLVENTCVQCTSKPMNQGATLSQVYFLNPLSNNPDQLREWETNNGGNSTQYFVQVKQEYENDGRQVVIDTGRALLEPPFYLRQLHHDIVHSAQNVETANYVNLFGNNGLGLVANQLCSSEYGVVFNLDNLNNTLGICVGFQSCEVEDYINFQKASFFPLSFNITGNAIRNEIVVSPPVPQGYIRVVLRTSRADADGALGYKFQLGVYNRGFNPRTHKLLGGNVCDTLRLGGHNGNLHPEYWFPDCIGNKFIQDSVYIHPEVGGTTESNTIIQSMTIKLNGGNVDAKRNYGFFVEAVNAVGRVPMGSLTDRDIYVDVYTHVPAALPRYSLYKPHSTYSIKSAAAGNQLGKYWHVFNLESNNLDADVPQYGIRAPHRPQWDAELGRNREIWFSGGKIATDDNDFYCYIGGEHCNQE